MKIRGFLTVVGFNILLFLVLVEFIGLVDYFTKTRELYYFSSSQAELLPTFHQFERQATAYRLHPYFGFVLAPSPLAAEERAERNIILNNYGFGSPYNYPYEPTNEREIVVGVFGGSVATKLERFERVQGIIGQQIAAAFGRNRSEVTVLGFAQGGFKQPQQLLIYNYFRALGQRFDVVINIDGFNEVALSDGNVRSGVAVDMPSMGHISTLQHIAGDAFADHAEAGYLEAMVNVRKSYREYQRTYDRVSSQDAWELRFAFGFLIDRKLAKLARKRFRTELLAYQEQLESSKDGSWLYLNPLPASSEDPTADALTATIELWAEASSLMASAQSRSGGSYFHFLQPNQYHATQRVYSEQERAVAFDQKSSYAEPAIRGYPKLRDELVHLKASGVSVYDLSELFDHVDEEVYIDNCCHYTDAGQEALARAIAEVVSSANFKKE